MIDSVVTELLFFTEGFSASRARPTDSRKKIKIKIKKDRKGISFIENPTAAAYPLATLFITEIIIRLSDSVPAVVYTTPCSPNPRKETLFLHLQLLLCSIP